jgi:DNA modification methylase
MTSKPNDIILDNFSGTSVCGAAVMKLGQGRKYVGYEPSPEYMVASKLRLSEYQLEQVA